MTIIRKFFDTAISEPASQVQPSIAEMMARHGVKSTSDNPMPPPVLANSTESKEQPEPAPEVPQAAMANETSTAESANPEPPKPAEEPTPVYQVQTEPEPVKVPSWQEVLKSQQPDTVLKELGYDEKVVDFVKELKEVDPKMVAFLNHWKSKNGDVSDYLRELTTDYSKMSAEDVMRHQLRQEYPTASPQQLEALFKREVVKAYSLDSEDEDESAEGRLLLEAKADKYREVLSSKQKDFLLPKPPEPKAPEPDNGNQEAIQQFEAYKSQLTNHQYSKDILTNKAITIGEGDEKFSFPVDPNALTEVLLDSEKWASSIFDIKQDGGKVSYQPKVEHQMLVAAVAKYGMEFVNEIAKHFKTVGEKSAIAPIESASRPDGSSPAAPQSAPKNPAEAMARMGRFSG